MKDKIRSGLFLVAAIALALLTLMGMVWLADWDIDAYNRLPIMEQFLPMAVGILFLSLTEKYWLP